jgi:flagellar biosynthesis/type III secretory pathway protein FliH
MSTPAAPYAFPLLRNFDDAKRDAERARLAQLEAAFDDATTRGFSEGVARGQREAEAAARQLLEESHREGLQSGHAEGLEQMERAAAALRDAYDKLQIECARMRADAEGFCVEVALAIAQHFAEADSVRTEFIVRSVKAAVEAIAPEPPKAIFLHPDVRVRVEHALKDLPLRDDENLAHGSARVEAGRLLVQSSIEEAFAQIRDSVLELKANRNSSLASAGGTHASDS